ncbi:thiamine pyrophosphate-dependent dehydrogenase E1 component subunit alpha [Salinicoccus halitifaciens]|uniref:Pyruvate dehydrogenase E1 component alpha subunit n=1 Tax=Salinicoccus halitifaciens TaxID=1073415 RepID=A0ABV2ECD7_9STAP|nr:thiamine pyrophosphate-dependent dehydrogenase E1 component subunit alpha [Salinicoccus halitifaciens]MCD2138752.1 thiamine pyrophosphate-dependent dehydrogenase E1 component subunit alpha [Salinicoccus halitifaciens]
MSISNEELRWMYEHMYKIRYYEDKLEEVYMEGKQPVFNIGAGTVPGEMHLSTGQEPAAVGISVHLRQDDIVTSPHRPHHHAIAKGVDLKRMTAEIFGKKTGLSKGKGGHMHLFDPDVHFSCSGIVGAGMPHAVGAALAAKKRGKDSVAVAYIGEGAANQGSFHESLNLAALWDLPVIVVVENNKYGISVPRDNSTAVPSNDLRAGAYGIEGHYVEGNNLMEMYRVSKQAVERGRKGEGPSIIEIETYRYLGHFQGDAEQYRPEDEVKELRAKDQVNIYRDMIIKEYDVSENELEEIEGKVREEVDAAYQFARDSEYPDESEALEDVFV